MSSYRFGRLDVHVDPTVGPAGPVIYFVGRLDEAANLGDVGTVIPPGHVVLDTSGLTFVNSVGMREWVRLIRVLRDRGVVTLVRVADVLMAHMNVVREFAQSVRIASFHAAYVCDACGVEATPLIDVMQHGPALAAMQAPRMQCMECGGVMQLADFPERYLTIFKA